jgi:hypothetical protein
VGIRVDDHALWTHLLVQPADHPLQFLVVTFAELVRGCRALPCRNELQSTNVRYATQRPDVGDDKFSSPQVVQPLNYWKEKKCNISFQ